MRNAYSRQLTILTFGHDIRISAPGCVTLCGIQKGSCSASLKVLAPSFSFFSYCNDTLNGAERQFANAGL